jgi:hypothetical protein
VRGVRREVSARVVCEQVSKVPASFSCRRDGATPLKGQSGTSRPELPAKATAQIVFHHCPWVLIARNRVRQRAVFGSAVV